jgi:hypothetical protein
MTIEEPSKFVAARAALEKAEADLGDPSRLGDLRSVINFLLREMSGVSPQIEKDIAKQLVLTYRNKVLSEVKLILANFDSHEPGFLEYWHKVMELFADVSLADDPEFNACKAQLLTRHDSHPIDIFKAADVDNPKKALQVPRRQDDLHSKIVKEVRSMLHAKSLRVIGQSLEMLRLREFGLEKQGDFFIVRSESLTAAHQWILKDSLAKQLLDSPTPDPKSTLPTVGDGWLCYGPLDIARLNEQEQKKRDRHAFEQKRAADKLADLLRILGEHLDSKGATAFKILWARNSVSVDYQTPNEAHERKDFTVEKLQQLASYSRFRRSSGGPSIRSR